MAVKRITCNCDQQSRGRRITTVQSDCSAERIKQLFTEVTRLPGFSLTTEVCVVDCGPHGSCIGGVCQCEEGWTGPECEQRDCHPRCIDHGVCREGKCDCHQGWTGEHCTIGEYAHRRLNVKGMSLTTIWYLHVWLLEIRHFGIVMGSASVCLSRTVILSMREDIFFIFSEFIFSHLICFTFLGSGSVHDIINGIKQVISRLLMHFNTYHEEFYQLN